MALIKLASVELAEELYFAHCEWLARNGQGAPARRLIAFRDVGRASLCCVQGELLCSGYTSADKGCMKAQAERFAQEDSMHATAFQHTLPRKGTTANGLCNFACLPSVVQGTVLMQPSWT